MAQMVQYVRSRLPGGSANNALTQMMSEDQRRAKIDAEGVGCFRTVCCCAGCAGVLKLYNTRFGFKECQEEVDMLTAGLTESDRTQVTANSLRIFRRRRFCGESNYMIACDPIADGGTKLTTVSILRVSKSSSCQTSVRRVSFDARHIIQVEMSDAWETTELVFEVITFIFGASAWGYVYRADPKSDRQETMRNNVLVVLAFGLISLIFVIVLNFVNTRFFRATQLVVDTCMPGRAMVTSNRFFSEVGVHTENSATNTAQQYIVTLPHVFAMDARQILQQWKQIADNMSTQLNLAAETPSVVPAADTRNIGIMLPAWARPVAEVVTPPPGAVERIDEEQPLMTPPRDGHLFAGQEDLRNGAGVAQRSQRRREAAVQLHPYVPPE